MSFLDFFKPLKKKTTSTWTEFGGYNSTFIVFGNDIYKSEIVKSCVRPLAEFTSKASAKCSDQKLERLLNNRPNMYMDGRDFLYKVRTMYEIYNTVFLYIQRDNRAKVSGIYPMPYSRYEALEYLGNLYIKFTFKNTNTEPVVIPWEDLAVIRKDYNLSDIAGDSNDAILDTLQRIETMNQGNANAIKATANLRGILKSTKAMLAPAALKEQRDAFVKDYLNLENEGGIASLDASQEFTPITMSPKTADFEQLKEARENVYRYFGVNDDIVMSRMNSDQIEAFYEMKIEPFLVTLSEALTSKIYGSGKLLSYDNWIVYEANKLQFASLTKKISIYKEVVLYGGMTRNEWRSGCNMPPIEGGDKMIMRKDAGMEDENEVSEDVNQDE